MTGRAPFMAEFAQQLLTEHPKEAARVFSPLVALFEEVLDGAAAAGAVRPGPASRPDRRGRPRGHHVQLVLVDHRRCLRSPNGEGTAEDLWDLIFHGIGTGPTA